YILERRYARKLPGNMLERPEILLNPWAVRDTEAEKEKLQRGEDYARKRPGEAGGVDRARAQQAEGRVADGGSARSIDFLAQGPVELLNLQPEKDGKIQIDLAAFGDRQH
ncbi:MAG: hypothetical protein GWO24_27475, partial [Akkermansiaceae bacterium]|nr:hypothetical protein [Akkermansiaceae bacterium]